MRLSYAVVRMAKLKQHDLKGIQFHNQRERDSKTNPDINLAKTHLNYELHNDGPIDYNKRVKEIIESQKEGTRKIRKDAVLVNEFLVTSDRKFFDELSPDREKEFFKESLAFFKERYGEQNIAFATVHVDEKTPHMHVGIVPMRDGKLQGKNVFNRQELLAIQDEFPKHMRSKGFDLERGEKGSDREHIATERFKAQTIREEVQSLETERETLQKDVEGLLKAVEGVKVADNLEIKENTPLFGPKTVKLAAEEFEGIKTLAKSSEVLKTRNTRLQREIESLQIENSYLKKRTSSLAKKNEELLKENEGLKDKVGKLEKLQEILQETIRIIKISAEKHLGIGLERMSSYIGESRLHVLFNKFGKQAFEKTSLDYFVPSDEHTGAEKYMEKINSRQPEQEKEKPIRNRERNDFELDR